MEAGLFNDEALCVRRRPQSPPSFPKAGPFSQFPRYVLSPLFLLSRPDIMFWLDMSTPGPKTALHPWLRHTSNPLMSLDLRINPGFLRFRELDRNVNGWDLSRFACEPPVLSMRLFSDFYPWYVEVESSNPTGVTMHDLFGAIWQSMQTCIMTEDYWNSEMDDEVRRGIAHAYEVRCGEDREELARGIRRVDYFMDRVKLEGFVRTKDGLYEMKIKKVVL